MIRRKHIAILFLSTLFAIFFSGFIDWQNAAYFNSDLHKYIAMAKAFPGIATDVIKPFVYRIGAPWFAGLLPFSIPVNFLISNSVALFLLALAFYLFLREYGINSEIALVTTIFFQFNRYFFQFLAWNYFQLSDTLGLAMLFYGLVLMHRKKILPLAVLILTGMLIKEYMLMLIPAGFILLWEAKSGKKDYLVFSAISLGAFLVFFTLRQVIHAEGGEGLLSQYVTQLVYYSKPVLLVKRFLIPFAPFILLPFIFPKKFADIFKEYKHLLVYALTVIVLSFFGESERLISPLAPVFYLFVGKLLIDYFFNSETGKIKMSKEFLIILLMVFASSFYHLWGIIELPDKLYSLIITVLTTIGVTIIFTKKKFA